MKYVMIPVDFKEPLLSEVVAEVRAGDYAIAAGSDGFDFSGIIVEERYWIVSGTIEEKAPGGKRWFKRVTRRFNDSRLQAEEWARSHGVDGTVEEVR